LNNVQGVSIESEGVLKRCVGRELIFEEDFTIYSDFDFTGDEREIKYD
jgi:hypothetical protein